MQKQSAQKQSSHKGPKTIPSQLQVAGGVVLKALPFKIVAYHDDGTPKLFELQAAGTPFDITEESTCMLFAREDLLRAPWPGNHPPRV
jgi:hypothetical protein